MCVCRGMFELSPGLEPRREIWAPGARLGLANLRWAGLGSLDTYRFSVLHYKLIDQVLPNNIISGRDAFSQQDDMPAAASEVALHGTGF